MIHRFALVLCLPLFACDGGSNLPPAPTVPLILTGVQPDSCFAPGGVRVTLAGSGLAQFSPGSHAVMFDGSPASAVTVVDDNTLTCDVPAGAAGTVDVALDHPGSTTTLAGAFTYFTHPPSFLAADVRIDTDTPTQGHSSYPEICIVGDYVYVTWRDERNGDSDIYFNRSTDGGQTWQIVDTRLDTDVAGASVSTSQEICCSGDNVYVVWSDSRNGEEDIYFNVSTDRGETWLSSDVRLETDVPGMSSSGQPEICCHGDNVYVVWKDARNGEEDIYFNVSTDAGATWRTSDVRLDTDIPGADCSFDPEICCAGDNVFVTWPDERSGNDHIYFNGSSDAGTTWLSSDVRLDRSTSSREATDSEICCEGNNVYVVWQDDRDGKTDVYLNRSQDAGVTWLAADVRIDTDTPGAARSCDPDVRCSGGNVYVAWEDRRNAVTGFEDDIYFNSSLDGGVTWQSSDVRLDSDAQLGRRSDENDPRICCDGKNVCVVYEKDIQPQGSEKYSVYSNVSTDGGVTWLSEDFRIDANSAPTRHSERPRVACDGARLYVVWHDDRDRVRDIYFSRNTPLP